MKKFVAEFKEFALKGSMIDLAVGIIIGSAFTALVTSLVDDIINPLLGLLLGKIDFSNLYVSLDGVQYASLAEAEEAGGAVLKYGAFISGVINFIIMAFVVFCIVKVINTIREKEEAKKQAIVPPETKICPFCQTEIAYTATRCPSCTSMLDESISAEMKED